MADPGVRKLHPQPDSPWAMAGSNVLKVWMQTKKTLAISSIPGRNGLPPLDFKFYFSLFFERKSFYVA